MLQFMSFVVVLAILAGALGLIIMTIHDASESVLAALFASQPAKPAAASLLRRPIRQIRPTSPYYAPLRAAA